MVATYRLNANEISQNLLELIRKRFSGKEIEITVVEQDATEHLMSSEANRRHLDESIGRIERGEGLVRVDFNDLGK